MAEVARPNSQFGNNLLGALSADDLALLSPHLEEWWATPGQAIHNVGDEVTHVYFPCGASIACFLVVLEEGHAVEAALVGREGAVGGLVSEGSLPAYAHAEAQSAGLFLRMPLKELEAAKQGSPAVRSLFVRYSDCLLAQSFSLWLATPHTPFRNVRLERYPIKTHHSRMRRSSSCIRRA